MKAGQIITLADAIKRIKTMGDALPEDDTFEKVAIQKTLEILSHVGIDNSVEPGNVFDNLREEIAEDDPTVLSQNENLRKEWKM